MKVIPNTPYDNDSTAELRTFEKLKQSFVSDNKYLAFHSLNLHKHPKNRAGEADFVILCEFGLFVLEVKGGGISCDNGVWHSTGNKGKNETRNPFVQAEDAMHGILSEIDELHEFDKRDIPWGFGVVFPDGEWREKGSEWDLLTICDSRKFRNFESWLGKFFEYWHNKSANKYKKLTTEKIKQLGQYLRPKFEVLELLSVRLSNLQDTVASLTQDQYEWLDSVDGNKRVLCAGGAGTGKTFLAVELAKRMARKNKNVLLVCKSEWLKQYLDVKIKNEFVIVSTIDSAKIALRRKGLDHCDMLIVDEGQDLFNFDDIDTLSDLVNGGLEYGEWYIFHDINNQSGLFIEEEQEEEILKWLDNFHPSKNRLITNCRSTKPILEKVQNSLHLDMGNRGTGEGPKVIEIVNTEEKGVVLEREISKLLKSGVNPASITILSNFSYEQSSVSYLSDDLQRRIAKLDDFSIRSFPNFEAGVGISFAEIRNFKGLENEVIIIVDLIHPKKIKKDESKVLHYVAMSRASGLLLTIWESKLLKS
ncbi:MAG TPA: DUF2075 domain-containing protein [Flavobacteriales bacterium]|jgi:hypothetical protein|nr:DUF2075 domain-containing protein [Flavobacteriales bacterium]